MALVLLLSAAGPLRAQQPQAAYPAWWTSQGVVNPAAAPNDYAAANQGQAKNMAVGAVSELNGDLAQFGGAGEALDQLAEALLSGTSAQTNDYAVVNLGQLKALAQPFYDRLLSLGYAAGPLSSGTYPWLSSGHAANDYAVANLGQLKYLFSFDLVADANGNGIPDWWEQKYFPGGMFNGQPGIDPAGTVGWSNGTISNLQAYQQGLNPLDFYNGQAPALNIVSGNNQTGAPGGLVPAALVVSVSGSAGPLVGAPVTFTVSGGGGQLQASPSSGFVSSATILADSQGQARMYFRSPGSASGGSQITATAGAGELSGFSDLQRTDR